MNSPHVFVATANILNLRCDAWMLLTDSRFRIEDHWLDGSDDMLRTLAAESVTAQFRRGTSLAEVTQMQRAPRYMQ